MHKKTSLILVFNLIFVYIAPELRSQHLTINEVKASNSTTITDEDGDYPDWIELFNNNNVPMNLTGHGLSDNENNPFKWVFLSAIIQPQQHLLIFASDKDRCIAISHWDTIINWGDEWRYRLGDSSISADWNFIDYDDSAKLSGASVFGYGDGDDATVVTNTIS